MVHVTVFHVEISTVCRAQVLLVGSVRGGYGAPACLGVFESERAKRETLIDSIALVVAGCKYILLGVHVGGSLRLSCRRLNTVLQVAYFVQSDWASLLHVSL